MFQLMRGTDTQQSSMFSYLSPEERVPANHPLRPIRLMVDDALKALSPSFSRLYSAFGRHRFRQRSCCEPLLLQVLYTVRSERMLMEQLGIQPASSMVCWAEHGPNRMGAELCSPKIGPALGR